MRQGLSVFLLHGVAKIMLISDAATFRQVRNEMLIKPFILSSLHSSC